MKKVYYFDISLPKKEVIALIHRNAKPRNYFSPEGYMSYIIRGDKIILQSLPFFIRHPLQRMFVAQLTGFENWTMIKGHFKYPSIRSAIGILIAAFYVYQNIDAVLYASQLSEKLVITALFFIFYLGIFFIFLTGRMKKKEKEVIDFINRLARTGGQDTR